MVNENDSSLKSIRIGNRRYTQESPVAYQIQSVWRIQNATK